MELSGVDKIDEQHKKLFELFYAVKRWEGTNKEFPALFTMVTGLLDYANLHFNDEEAWLKDYGYPEYDAQEIAHEQFVLTIQMAVEHIGDDITTFHNVLEFIEDWLINHINLEAVEFRKYITNA